MPSDRCTLREDDAPGCAAAAASSIAMSSGLSSPSLPHDDDGIDAEPGSQRQPDGYGDGWWPIG